MHYQLHTQEAKEQISQNRKGKGVGVNNAEWKGDKVSYRNLHRWVERWAGKANHCSEDFAHEATRYHWANISGKYMRDLNDFRQLCPSCNGRERRFRNMKERVLQ